MHHDHIILVEPNSQRAHLRYMELAKAVKDTDARLLEGYRRIQIGGLSITVKKEGQE